ncbi:MAG: iron-containing alcohol dehydrogenase [Candidatus Marsarchaeota archaeon]
MAVSKQRAIHEVALPEHVAIGPGLVGVARDFITSASAAGGPVLLVHGKQSYLPLLGAVAGVERVDFEIDKPPTLSEVLRQGDKLASTARFSLVVSIGGGSVIDSGKLLSSKLEVASVSLPTVLSHDGIASPRVSLFSSLGPSSIAAKIPRAVFIDLRVASLSPHKYVAAGFGDTIAKKTAVRDWKLASEKGLEEYGDYSAALAELSADHVLSACDAIAQGTEGGLRVLAEALVSSGIAMAIAGSSRPASGSEHQFAHALQLIAPGKALHGEACGVGTIMMSKLHGLDWEEIRYSLHLVGAPVSARELGVSDMDVIRSLLIANKVNNRYTILSNGLSFDEAERLARSTKVIQRQLNQCIRARLLLAICLPAATNAKPKTVVIGSGAAIKTIPMAISFFPSSGSDGLVFCTLLSSERQEARFSLLGFAMKWFNEALKDAHSSEELRRSNCSILVKAAPNRSALFSSASSLAMSIQKRFIPSIHFFRRN